jgi:hypothetical protein
VINGLSNNNFEQHTRPVYNLEWGVENYDIFMLRDYSTANLSIFIN